MPAGAKRPPVELSATVEQLVQGGDGLAFAPFEGERRAILAPAVAVGDEARFAVDFSRRPARAQLLKLLSGSPDRVEPACPHTARCGGCDWMHLSADAQATGHAGLIRAVL